MKEERFCWKAKNSAGEMGHRIAKHVIDNSTFMLEKSTYYLLDASGNQLALYEQVVNESTTDFNLAERNIYGSTRLGTLYNTPQVATTSYGSIGSRTYELTNHLGNVLAVISDIVYPVSSGGSTIDYYQVGINKATDYSPFGVQLDGRNLSGGIADLGYRYGFQGQEKDDEIKSTGNSLNYEYRMHDPRIGRFFAIDPLASKYPHNSVYAFSENMVIHMVELEGLEAAPAKNVHYYNMNRQEDGSYSPDYHHSSSILVIKSANNIFINTSTGKSEVGLTISKELDSRIMKNYNYDKPIQDEYYTPSTTNVYTYWNNDGSIKR